MDINGHSRNTKVIDDQRGRTGKIKKCRRLGREENEMKRDSISKHLKILNGTRRQEMGLDEVEKTQDGKL